MHRNKLFSFCKQAHIIVRKINKPNIMCMGIDPGVNLGISIFTLENVMNDKLTARNICAIQKNFIKKLDFMKHDTRIHEINLFIQELMIKYTIDLVCLEQAYYSRGKFSYAENLLARYTGSIYLTIRSLNAKIISMSYPEMKKLILGQINTSSNKECIIDEIEKIYPYKILKTQYDKLDAIGYGYAIYLCLKVYYKHQLK